MYSSCLVSSRFVLIIRDNLYTTFRTDTLDIPPLTRKLTPQQLFLFLNSITFRGLAFLLWPVREVGFPQCLAERISHIRRLIGRDHRICGSLGVDARFVGLDRGWRANERREDGLVTSVARFVC